MNKPDPSLMVLSNFNGKFSAPRSIAERLSATILVLFSGQIAINQYKNASLSEASLFGMNKTGIEWYL